MLTETIEGKGTLRSTDGFNQYEVSYRFDITTRVVDRPGFPRVEAEKHSTGTVKSLKGEVIPPGYKNPSRKEYGKLAYRRGL